MNAVKTLLSSRIARGVGANVFSQGATALIQLTAVPIFATHWGVHAYGVWLMLFTIPSYLSLADFGFATAAGNAMTASVARGDRDHAVAIFQGAWASIGTITTGMAVASLCVVQLLPGTLLANVNAITGDHARFVISALLLYGFVALQGGIFVAGFRCQGLYARGVFLNVVLVVAENSVAFTTVFLGGGIEAVALAYLTCRFAGVLFMGLQLRLASPWLTPARWRSNWASVRAVVGPAFAVMALPAAQAIFLQGSILVVGAAGGPAAVPAFTTTRTLVRLGVQATTAVNLALMPEFTVAVTRNDMDRKANLIAMTLGSILAILLPVFLMISTLGETIIPIWTHGTVHPPLSLILAMSLMMLLNGLWWPFANLILALNRHAIYSYVYLAGAVIAMAAAYPLAKAMGATGVALALVALDGAMLVYVGVQADRCGILSFGEFRRAFGKLVALAGSGFSGLNALRAAKVASAESGDAA